MSLLVPLRVDTPELLDEHDAPAADVARSLIDLRRINRWLGGIRVYRGLLRLLAGSEHVSVLDLGTGTSDLLDALPSGALRVGIDFKLDHLVFQRNGSRVRRVVADAQQLPIRDAAVDVVTSAHFMHHFSPDENASILRESLRICRRGVAVNDTQRHLAPLVFVRVISALRLVGRITRYDAPASVLRGYTPAEASAIAQRAGASRFRVLRAFPFRVGVLLWK